MQNPIQKFRQSSIVFEKPGILFENLKTSHTFPVYQCLQERVRDFILFCSDLEVFAKTKKTWFLHTRFFTFLLTTQDTNNVSAVV